MWKISLRGILSLLLLTGGIASFTYGVKYHIREVIEEQEIEISIEIPEMTMDQSQFDDQMGEPGFEGEQGFGGEPGFDGPPPDMMFPGLPPEMQKVTQVVMIGKEETEMVILRDLTVGGIVLLPSGKLKRTYTGKPPSLCPT